MGSITNELGTFSSLVYDIANTNNLRAGEKYVHEESGQASYWLKPHLDYLK